MKSKRKKIALLAAFAALLATAGLSACGGGTDSEKSAFSASDSTDDVSSVSTPSDSDSDIASDSESEAEHVHEWGEWTVTKEATCTEAGSKQRVCGICGKPETETIPAGHTYEDGICTVCGETKSSEGLEYALNSDNGGYSVTGIGSCTDTDIVIPSVYKGKPVTSIRNESFRDCRALTSVTISNGVTSIGYAAFSGCSSLTSVVIPYSATNNNLTNIGDSAFDGCNGIEKAILPASAIGSIPKTNLKTVIITKGGSIKDNAFTNCNSLANVTIENGVKNVGSSAFSHCNGLASVTIENGVMGIGSQAFWDCGSLTSIVIPDSVTSIGTSAFSDCNELTSVTLGSGVTNIGSTTFYRCDGLTSIVIPKSVTSIGEQAFAFCKGLTDVTIGDGVTSIGEQAFYECSNLKNIEISDGVTSIGKYAFYNCTGLTSIEISDGVTDIGDRAFYNTAYYNDESNREEGVLYIGKHLIEAKTSISGGYTIKSNTLTIADSAFSWCNGLANIVIPDGVKSIGESAFSYCSSLTSVTIGNGVKSIGESAFYDCYKLIEVYNLSALSITKGSSENGYIGYYAKDIYASSAEPSKLSTNEDGFIIYTDGESKILIGYTGAETDLTLPEGITEIYQYAFYERADLTSIVIPDGVTSIGEWAFTFCADLTSIGFKGTMAEWDSVAKGLGWDSAAGNYTVTCTDGKLDKSGNKIE